ncbi:NUDIX hydrolase [Metaplanococcus flavidus]|uniref:NUDIX hydrolase n=1 Tax=Metaplanococcus flavidus TaxID=569883 RepID=A0ABW3LFK5_9BACL
MVRQYVQKGDRIWNFPDCGIEDNETSVESCLRAAKEEKGYDVLIKKLLYKKSHKYTFVAEIIGGELYLDSENEANNDIIDIAWIAIDDIEKFHSFTTPLLKLLNDQK